ncbi:MAG: PKD domain-containing protein [Bacteroidota bacterium]
MIYILLQAQSSILLSQPNAQFEFQDTVCLNSTVEFTNTSANSVSYVWDFCFESIQNAPLLNEQNLFNGLSIPEGINFFYAQGSWFSFVSSTNDGKLFLLDFGSDLSSIPDTTQVNISGDVWTKIKDIRVIEESGTWYGLVISYNSNKLYRVDFGDSIRSELTSEDLGNLDGWNTLRGIDLAQDGSDVVAIVTNFGNKKVSLVRFPGGITNTPSVLTLTDPDNLISGPMGVSLIKSSSSWYGLLTSFTNNKILFLDFGLNLYSNPTITDLGSSSSPTSVFFAREGPNYYGLTIQRNNGIQRISFGSSLSPLNYSISNDIGGLSSDLNNIFAFDVVNDFSLWKAFTISSTGLISSLSFPEGMCSTVSVGNSTDFEPNISYSSSGQSFTELYAIDEFGRVDMFQDTIVVLSQTAPDIDFSTLNQCIDSQSLFESINVSGDIISYSWDFDDDGLEDSDLENPEISFLSDFGLIAGDHVVTLTVSNGLCENTISKVVSIFNSPTADFSPPASNICTNTALDFTNSSTYDGGAPITFSWDFNEDGLEDSHEESPSYIFDFSGDYSIQLVVGLVDGCTDTIQKIVSVQSGPTIDFDWTNNCFGEAVQFNNTSQSGLNIDYSWDFGDGSGISTAQHPNHTYSLANDYTVILTVDDQTCISELQKIIGVNDQSLVTAFFGNGIENIPIEFLGIDQTHETDSIISWSWDFDGLATSSSKDTSFTFINPNTYSISLAIETAQGCWEENSYGIVIDESTESIADFSISNSCRDENIVIENQSINAKDYVWDFCFESLNTTPNLVSSNVNNSLMESEGIEIIKDGQIWYGFISSRQDGKLYRLNFGSSLESSDVDTTEVILTGDPWTALKDIRFIKKGAMWYGLAITYSNNKLFRVTFGTSLGGDGVSTDLGNLDGWNTLRGIDLVQEGDDVIAVISSFSNNKITLVRFPGGIENAPEIQTVSNPDGLVSGPMGVSLIKENNNWFGLLASYSNDNVLLLDFGTTLFSDPSISVLENLVSPTATRIVKEGEAYTGFVSQRNLGIKRYHFGQEITNGLDSTSLLFLSGVNLSNVFAISVEKDISDWYIFTQNTSGDITNRLDFGSGDCSDISLDISNSIIPYGLKYSTSGDYLIELIAIHENGNVTERQRIISISENIASDIAFTFSGQCILSPITFTSINTSSNITSYSWDFDSDGIEDSSDPNPTYQFPSTGTYNVRLTVESDEGCGNFVEQEITIYPEPTIPSFTIPQDSFCVAEPVIISNLTDDTAWDGLVTYTWTVTDLGDTTVANPELTFSLPGEKIISVVAQIPGCESITVKDTIQIIDIPMVDFTADPVCDGETTVFNNLSESGSVYWDFGDGSSSIEVSPTHNYSNPGTYSVSLTITNDLGCDNTQIKTIDINALPQANFQYDILCEGSENVFEDMSMVDQADITAWEWSIDGEVVSNIQSPGLIFDAAGDYTVGLTATSSDWCQSYYEEMVSVGSIPQVDFSIEIGCIDEETMFSDLTDPTTVLTRSWMIDGTSFTTTDPTMIFSEPGTFQATLTITNNQLCTSSLTREFIINDLPVPDFMINGECNNKEISFEDASVDYADPIVDRQWFIDGTNIGNGLSASISGYNPAEYLVSLEVTTENGCMVSVGRTLIIRDNPVASFTPSNDYGVPPFQLSFENTSLDYSTSEWYVNDNMITTDTDPTIIFNNPGDHIIRLITYNSFGCADSSEMVINSVVPIVDLIITDIQLIDRGAEYNIVLDVLNSSNLPIEAIGVNVELQNQFSISEQVYQRINSGAESVITLGTSVPISGNQLEYLCVSLSSPYPDDEANLANNEACITIEPKINYEPPYPNPTTDLTSVRYILPNGGKATLEVYDITGNLEISQMFETLPKGLNTFTVEVGDLNSGIYLLRFVYEGNVIISKIIKR